MSLVEGTNGMDALIKVFSESLGFLKARFVYI